jgi:hypothetical protein
MLLNNVYTEFYYENSYKNKKFQYYILCYRKGMLSKKHINEYSYFLRI